MPGYVEFHREGATRSGEPLCQIVPDGTQLNLWRSEAQYGNIKRVTAGGNEWPDKPDSVLIGEDNGFMEVFIGDGVSQAPRRITTDETMCIPGYSPELEAEVDVWSTPSDGADYLIFNAFALATREIDISDWTIKRTGFSPS